MNLLDPRTEFLGKVSGVSWEQTICRRARKDVLWCPANSGPVGCRNTVLTLHDGAVIVHPEWFSRGYATWRRWAIPRLVSACRRIITVSEFAKGILCERLGIEEDRIVIIHNGVDTDRFSVLKEDTEILARYPMKGPYFLFVGSMDPRKNLERLLQAWMRLSPNERAHHELVIAGGQVSTFAETRFAIPDNVRLLGYVSDDDLPTLYRSATGFLFPTLFEGFGLPVLESMAAGTPVLSSDIPVIREVAGSAAILVNPLDVDEIGYGIARLAGDAQLRETLSNLGRVRVQAFSWEKTASETWEVLRAAEQD